MFSRRAAASVLMLIGLCSCTTPNPRACQDGLCNDQRYPYCDKDGTFEGQVDTCIAVECEASSFVRCLGDRAAKCNATGNDYDFDNCPHGCNDETGCRECATNEQCPAGAPLCDAEGTCRACIRDDDCASRVCETGSCVAESGVLYASSGGADNSACLKAAPCSVMRAFTLARAAAVLPIVRLLPGTYVDGFNFQQATTLPYNIVATGATLAATTGLSVTNGASVVVRGLSIASSETAIVCGMAGQAEAQVTFRDGVLTATSTSADLVRAEECAFEITGSDLQLNASNGKGLFISSNARLRGDRLRIRGSADGVIGVGGLGARMSLTLSNSVLDHVGLLVQATDSTDPGSYGRFGYNTFVLQSGNTIGCSAGFGSAHRTMTFDNNIVSGANVLDVLENNNLCAYQNNVLFPSVGRPNNTTGAALFRDEAGHDFHLTAASPAIDSAAATAAFPTATADLDGVTRPQGAKPDVGAYERLP